MYATTKEMKKTKRAGLGSIHAAGKIKMASRLANRLKSLSPYVDEKVFRSLQKRLENIPLSERRSQKIQASKGRFFVICLLNSTADRGPLMLGERPLLLAENASNRFYRSSGQWVRISIQWAWSRIQILCSANWLGLLMFFMFLGVDYLLKATCNKRSRDHPSFKQWVGILLILKIYRALKNYLTPERKRNLFQQSSMICIGHNVGGHTFALKHGGQNYFRPSHTTKIASCATGIP